MQTTTKKITRATFKSFIKNNKNLFLNNKSSFDGMVDGVMPIHDGFKPAVLTTRHENSFKYNLGIEGVWLVGSSRDWFRHYEDDQFIGIEVTNCCGDFILAIKK